MMMTAPLSFAFPFDPFALLVTLAVSIAAFSLLWVVSLKVNDAGIVDYYWGLGFVVIAWLTVILTDAYDNAAVLVALAATLWACRLTLHMVSRHIRAGVEDPRYARMRANGGPNFKSRSLFTIFWLQAVLMWLIAMPLHALATAGPTNLLFWLGLKLFVIGFLIECVADWQLMRFRNDPANKGRLLTTGLFAWSRHPNYFGELVLWWGLSLAVFSVTGSVYVFAGPALLSLILIKVSGPPMLADQLSHRSGYAQWVASTPAIVPRPPRAKMPQRFPAE